MKLIYSFYLYSSNFYILITFYYLVLNITLFVFNLIKFANIARFLKNIEAAQILSFYSSIGTAFNYQFGASFLYKFEFKEDMERIPYYFMFEVVTYTVQHRNKFLAIGSKQHSSVKYLNKYTGCVINS